MQLLLGYCYSYKTVNHKRAGWLLQLINKSNTIRIYIFLTIRYFLTKKYGVWTRTRSITVIYLNFTFTHNRFHGHPTFETGLCERIRFSTIIRIPFCLLKNLIIRKKYNVHSKICLPIFFSMAERWGFSKKLYSVPDINFRSVKIQ